MRRAALLLALLVLPALSPAVEATGHVVVWEYQVTAKADTPGSVHVDLAILGAKDRVRSFTFRPEDSPYTVSNFRVDGATDSSFDVTRDIHRIEFDVAVNRAGPVAGEYLSYLGPGWGLFRAEALSVPFNYTFPAGAKPAWDARVRFALPAGDVGANRPAWKSATPWTLEVGAIADRWRLEAGEALPRGFIAVGPLTQSTATAGGRTIRTVTLGQPLSYAAELTEYLDDSTAYLRTVYGDSVGANVLVVSAPDPMLRGGLGAPDSFYVHEASDLRTAAHEWTHVWQRFAGEETAGDSSVWLAEGDAELHGTMSLFAAGVWSLGEVNAYFAATHDNSTKEPLKSARLVDATFGHDRIAYTKGAIVLAALHERIALNTQGRLGLPDLLRELNRLADETADSRFSNAEALAVVSRLTGKNFAPFFTEYVRGDVWPGWTPFAARAQLVVVNVTTDPSLPIAGRPLAIRATVDNRGYARGAADFTLLLDGQSQGARRVDLQIAGSTTVEWRITAPSDAPHPVHDFRIGNHTGTIRVAAPSRLVPLEVSTVPTTPAALGPATVLVGVRNDGSFPAQGNVILLVDGAAVGDRNVTVGANSTTLVAFETTFTDEGSRRLTVRAYADGRFASLNATLRVGPRDRDGDGTPDATDAYPDNPALAEKGLVSDARNLVPIPALAAVAALACATLRRR